MNQPQTQAQAHGVNLQEVQINRFTDSLKDILTLKHPPKIKCKDHLVVAAKAHTNKPINGAALSHLCYFADSWNQEILLSRSGEGIRIEFKIKK